MSRDSIVNFFSYCVLKQKMYVIDTIQRSFHGLSSFILEVFCDRQNRNIYFLSRSDGIQCMDLKEIIPLHVCGDEIVSGFMRRELDTFIPVCVSNIVVCYAL